MSKQWKKVEKRHAELYGLSHFKTAFPAMFSLGVSHGKNYPDSVDDISALESKSGNDLVPNWLREAVEQAIINEWQFSIDGDGKQRIPYTVLHQNYSLYDDDIVCIRADVFREFFLPAIHALGKVLQMSWDAEKGT